jgi:hypothetical protein
MGLRYAGESPYVPAYLVPEAGAPTGLPDFEFALYDGTAQWTLDGDAEVLARVGEPLFQRSAEHYTSHGTTPFDHTTDYVAAARQGRVGVLGFPLGTSYFRHGYWPYRDLLRATLDAVLPERLVRTTAPISAEVTVTHQAASDSHGERWMVHVVNFSANRRGPAHLENYEDPIPLTDVELRIAVPSVISRAYLAPDGPELPVSADGDSWRVVIPRVDISAVVVLEVES